VALCGEERKADSSCVCCMKNCNTVGRGSGTDLAGCQNSTDFTNDRFIAAQVCTALKDKAQVILEIVSKIVAEQVDGKSDDFVVSRGTNNQPTA
jgi:hypothetical protein